MAPAPLQFLILALAVFRLCRLIGWDDLPPLARARTRLTGAEWLDDGEHGGEWVFTHPTLAHFLSCPFCTGFWISLGVYAAWLIDARWTLYAAVPLALNALAGLIAKVLDA